MLCSSVKDRILYSDFYIYINNTKIFFILKKLILHTHSIIHANNLIGTINTMFDSMIAVAFQIIFCVEMHANDIFLFFKNYF
jgi:hypothetical protein